MPRFPLQYEVVVDKGSASPLEIHAGHRPRLAAGPPPDFRGSDVWWSPEHLLVSAVASCYATTFFALAERAGLRVGGYRCVADGTLDRAPDGVSFTAIRLALTLRVVSDDVERARKIALDAKEHCFVAKSLKCPVHLSVEVNAS